jgi:acyl-CoA reductase-like NAD-dependent aldehyde dehydrogenase
MLMTESIAVYRDHYLNGRWLKAHSAETLTVYDSHAESSIATIPAGTVAEAASAVSAATEGFERWSGLPVGTRAAYLNKIALGIKARSDELATVIAREVGMPLRAHARNSGRGTAWHWSNCANVARNFEWEKKVGNSVVVREPNGVVGCIRL